MDKVFLTYNQQMKYLRDKKKIKCSGSDDKNLLCRRGYFNLINGYKEPFTRGKDTLGHYTYIKGTTLNHFELLRNFDNELRLLLLKYLTQIEEEVRAFASYKFDSLNYNAYSKSSLNWYEIVAYDPNCEVKKIISLISHAYTEISRDKSRYVNFYMDTHKVIPTWILTKVISFSTFINFLNCSKSDVKKSLCDLYDIKDISGNNDYNLLINSLQWIRIVRNSCAHNERVYDLYNKNHRIVERYLITLPNSYIKTRDQCVFDLLIYLKYYLPTDEYNTLINGIKAMLIDLSTKLPQNAFDNIRAKTGIKDIAHLDLLMLNSKNIEYNRF